MRWIVRSSLKFRFLLVAMAGGLLFFGVAKLFHTPVDVFPEFAPPRVEIQTLAVGLTASEVEGLITVPLEQALNGLPRLDVMRSKSVSQLSSIEMIFKLGTDLLQDRQHVQERLASVVPTLPTWAAPPVMMPPVSATSRIMKIGMTSKTQSLIDMSMASYWTIRERLLRVPGVANVAIWGERLKMPQVQVQTDKMAAAQVSLDSVMEATADALDAGILKYASGARIGTGGFVETAGQRMAVTHVLPIKTPEDLAQVPLAERDLLNQRARCGGRLGFQPDRTGCKPILRICRIAHGHRASEIANGLRRLLDLPRYLIHLLCEGGNELRLKCLEGCRGLLC